MSNEPNPFSFNPSRPSEINPYAPTAHVATESIVPADVEQFRRKYLSHEATVKSLGVLYLIGSIILVPMGIFMMIDAVGGLAQEPNSAGSDPTWFFAIVGFLYFGLGIFQGIVGYGLRKFRGWTRIAASVMSAFGLLGFPIGTLISGYFLYVLLSEKGKVVFSNEYQQVIAQTPHIKYKTSIVVWIFLGLLITLIVVGVIVAMAGSR